ncbi:MULTISPECIES: hypothetical protein [unclassified Streptomyces]|uniref:hypothetical protein n=1 Tax=unclassified Streptomyces TaxID=2593676 RepID=UPI002E299B74|nr:hypothetical protein [Streptomyces sp. NBC_01439]
MSETLSGRLLAVARLDPGVTVTAELAVRNAPGADLSRGPVAPEHIAGIRP